MRYESDALRGDIAALSGLRDEVAKVSELRGDIAALSGLRDEVARVAALRDDVAALMALRQDLGPAGGAAARTWGGCVRAHRAAVERDARRADRHAHPGEPNARGARAAGRRPGPDAGGRQLGRRPPAQELTGGWPVVRLESRADHAVRGGPDDRPAAAAGPGPWGPPAQRRSGRA